MNTDENGSLLGPRFYVVTSWEYNGVPLNKKTEPRIRTGSLIPSGNDPFSSVFIRGQVFLI
jgi:hypothetical protein